MDSILLLGADRVQYAASSIAQAVERMERALQWEHESRERHVARIEEAIERLVVALEEKQP